MRTRTREVQIFNMSLIDILCGALGAFCFMMLVLLPYYKPANEDLRKQEANTQDLLKQLEKLKDAAKDSALAQDMTEMIRRLEEQLRQMQGLLNQLTAENDTLKKENQSLADKNESLTEENLKQALTLNSRRPFVTLVSAASQQRLELYLQKEDVIGGLKSNPPFDPTLPLQRPFSEGDVKAYSPGSAAWMVRDIAPNARYKVYVKLVNVDAAARFFIPVEGIVVGESQRWHIQLPRVTLVAPRFWSLMGTLTGQDDGTFSFKAATQEERDAEWAKLSKTTPPPAQPSATATMSKEEQRAYWEKMDKERQKGEQQRRQWEQQHPPTASPAGASSSAAPIGPGGMMPQDRAFIEKLRQQQQQRHPSATASPTTSP